MWATPLLEEKKRQQREIYECSVRRQQTMRMKHIWEEGRKISREGNAKTLKKHKIKSGIAERRGQG